jgi:hypothetical protein
MVEAANRTDPVLELVDARYRHTLIARDDSGGGKVKVFDGVGSCFLMTGGAQAAFVKGSWFSTPRPSVKFSAPSRTTYMQRVLFEKYWLRRWF